MIPCDVFSEIAGRAWLSHKLELNEVNGMALEPISSWAGGGCSFLLHWCHGQDHKPRTTTRAKRFHLLNIREIQPVYETKIVGKTWERLCTSLCEPITDYNRTDYCTNIIVLQRENVSVALKDVKGCCRILWVSFQGRLGERHWTLTAPDTF